MQFERNSTITHKFVTLYLKYNLSRNCTKLYTVEWKKSQNNMCNKFSLREMFVCYTTHKYI